jgi:predicted nuclease with TOPRIM domain
VKIKKIAQRMRDYPYDIDMKLKWPECIEDYDEPPEELKKEQEEKERKQKIRKEKAIEDEQEMARLRELMAKKGGWYKMAQKNKQQELQYILEGFWRFC